MKAPQLLKYEEWQSGSGKWYCNDTSDLTSARALWYTPARMLNISLEEFVKMLINDFQVDYIEFNKILIYSWDSQAKMRVFKNWINKKAREGKWII